MSEPGYWMYETSGVLRPAIVAYLKGERMSDEMIAAMRAYLRQWMTGAWVGPEIGALRGRIDGLTSRRAISQWLADALDQDIDPL